MKLTYHKRTTNCEMIWLNTYFDLKRKNYSVYTEEYATFIRKVEITREQALLEQLSSDICIDLDLDFDYTKGRKKNNSIENVENIEFKF